MNLKNRRESDWGATISPAEKVIAGCFGTWVVEITVGEYGVYEGGRILIARRDMSDWGIPQFDRPKDAGYTTVEAAGPVRFRSRFDNSAFVSPWKPAHVIEICDHFLSPGDWVKVTYGDRRHGGPGLRAQTFAETASELRVFVDPFRTGKYAKMPSSLRLQVIGGSTAFLRVITPSEAVVGEPTNALVRAEDIWGNLSGQYSGSVELSIEGTVVACHSFEPSEGGFHWFNTITLNQPGVYRVKALDRENKIESISNPILCRPTRGKHMLVWGDLHGQTGESWGTGSMDEYFNHARDAAALDFVAYTGNDLITSSEAYDKLQRLTRLFYVPGELVTFLGYEWSAATQTGGDHNVYYLNDDEPMFRSSHWLIEDLGDTDAERHPLTELLETYRGREDVLLIPHVGGKRANLDFFDPDLMPLIEICSWHGYFQWFADDALGRGLKVGFCGGSDTHNPTPGAAPAGGVHPSVRGGFMGVYTQGLTREGLWEAFRERRCYATTGARIILWVEVDGHCMGEEFSTACPPEISASVHGSAPLESVEVVRGLDTVYSHPLAAGQEYAGDRIRIVWSGARAKGRRLYTDWSGRLDLLGGRIITVEEYAIENPLEGVIEKGEDHLIWLCHTGGESKGLIIQVFAPGDATLNFHTVPTSFSMQLSQITCQPTVIEAGGLGQQVRISRPTRNDGPRSVAFSWTDSDVREGVNPYYVRVCQADGMMAWSSPVFVTFTR